MDMLVVYALVALVSVVVGVLLRFIVYTWLVKNNRWLPEKATKVANITSGAAIGLALVAIGCNFLLSHGPHQ